MKFDDMATSQLSARRIFWLLWIAAGAAFVAVALHPASYRFTRLAGIALLFSFWFGLFALIWRRRNWRYAWLGITALTAGFLLFPAPIRSDPAALRQDYVGGLQRYEGVSYYWGGESPKGIDCSGLIRRGLIDSLFWRGLRAGDPALSRHAIALWWDDCSAKALGEEYHGLTRRVLETPSINVLDSTQLHPGDLAVTRDGVHIMAYLGGNRWIEADPGADKVIVVAVPSDIGWFRVPMRIVRWSILQ